MHQRQREHATSALQISSNLQNTVNIDFYQDSEKHEECDCENRSAETARTSKYALVRDSSKSKHTRDTERRSKPARTGWQQARRNWAADRCQKSYMHRIDRPNTNLYRSRQTRRFKSERRRERLQMLMQCMVDCTKRSTMSSMYSLLEACQVYFHPPQSNNNTEMVGAEECIWIRALML